MSQTAISRFAVTMMVLLLVAPRLFAFAQSMDTPDAIDTVAWSPGGDRIAIGSDHVGCSGEPSPAVTIVDAVTGETLIEFGRRYCNLVTLAWSPDGSRIAGTMIDGDLFVWNAGSGDMISQFKRLPDRTSVAWKPDGSEIVSSTVVTASFDATDPATGQSIRTYPVENGYVFALDWSPDGTRIAGGGSAGVVYVWDADSSQVLQRLDGHQTELRMVKWSPDGTRIASAGIDRTIRIWDAENGRSLLTIDQNVAALAWHPAGSVIASAASDGVIHFWDTGSGKQIDSIRATTAGSSRVQIAWSPDGMRLAYAVSRNDGSGGHMQIVSTPAAVLAAATLTP